MQISSFWEGILTSSIVAIGGTVIGWLRKRNSLWTSPVLYGIGGGTLIAFCIVGIRLLFAPPPPVIEPITTENIERHLRIWIDALGVSVKKDSIDANGGVYFEYSLTLHDGVPVGIARPKDRSRYLALQTAVSVSPEHKAVMATWSPEEGTRLVDELLLELARGKVAYQITGQPPQLDTIRIEKMVPIGNDLSEDTFARYLDDIDAQFSLAREEIRLLVARNTHAKPR
jgi:hypothetical protein